MKSMTRIAATLFASALLTATVHAAPMKALLIDGQNNHAWKDTSPVIKKIIEDTGMFTVDVATAPAKGGDMGTFKPKFADYKVIISNYNGEPWSQETKDAFEAYVKGGGGFVSVHAADNSFPEWKAYNEIIGLGGWGNRTEKDGPYVRYIKDKLTRDTTAGKGGNHGSQHDFVVQTRDARHPITAGLPEKWLHVKDELYEKLRGPAENMTVLASAYASPDQKGSGFDEPMLMVISYGKGRSFHTTLGHSVDALKCVGATVTLQRGTEWAATGKVTQKVPSDFPAPDKTSSRP